MTLLRSLPTPRSASFKRRTTLGQWLIRVLLTLVFLATAYPFFYLLSLAVMPYENFVRQAVHFGPSGFTLEYFTQILGDARFLRGLGISVLKTGLGTLLSVLGTLAAGYALSRRELRLARPLTLLFLVPLYVSGGLIPFFLVVRNTGLLDTFWALILPNFVASFYLFVVRTHYQGFPQELIDSARVDGASQFLIFWRIVLPTSLPIIATLTVLYGIGHWNDYFWPSFLVGPDLQPATVQLQAVVSNTAQLERVGFAFRGSPDSYVAAMAATLALPILITYPLLQRYFVQGIMVGAVKG